MQNSKKNLYQITEAARACGVSRSTLLRLEEKGLLEPAYISEESGRRYYDNFNVARVLQVEKFKSMGLKNEEIKSYYESGGEAEELLSSMKAKLSELQQSVEELQLRVTSEDKISVQEITLPETVCRMRQAMGRTIAEKYQTMFDFYGECIRKGYIFSDEPIFDICERKDFLDGYIGEKDYPFYVCIPMKEKTPDSIVLPACKALSVLYYGSYANVDEAWLTLGREVKKRNLKPVGFPRVIGIVAPYTGRKIAAERYCSRLVIPVE